MTTSADESPSLPQGRYPAATPPAAPSVLPESAPGPAPALRSAAASRRTSRRELVISVLAVVMGGLLAFAGSQTLTRHTQVLAVSHDVAQGSTITSVDLTSAAITNDSHLSPIPASQRSQVVGMVAQVPLVKGELLTRSQVGRSSGFAAGQMLVALPMKLGQFPSRGLNPGQRVLIVATPGTNGSSTASSSGNSSNGESLRGTDATVAEVGLMSAATQLTVIDVRVNSGDGVAVAQLASTGNLALILLPAGR